MSSPPSALTVRDLRRLWKPHKERLAALQDNHPTAIRFHRACSWLGRIETELDGAETDQVLINQWVAFNALYGRWDVMSAAPHGDRLCWKSFMDRILILDAEQRLVDVLQTHKPLVISIFDDAFLSAHFWVEPSRERSGQARLAKIQGQRSYVNGDWKQIVDQLLERIYLLRCQLIHGAATCGGKLNRRPLKHCTTMLQHLLMAVLLVYIEHGADEDWGELCYPPLRQLQPR